MQLFERLAHLGIFGGRRLQLRAFLNKVSELRQYGTEWLMEALNSVPIMPQYFQAATKSVCWRKIRARSIPHVVK